MKWLISATNCKFSTFLLPESKRPSTPSVIFLNVLEKDWLNLDFYVYKIFDFFDWMEILSRSRLLTKAITDNGPVLTFPHLPFLPNSTKSRYDMRLYIIYHKPYGFIWLFTINNIPSSKNGLKYLIFRWKDSFTKGH